MKLSRKIILGVLAVFIFAAWMHPFYIGVSHVRISQNQQEAQVEVRLFTDDIQAALSASGMVFSPRKSDSLTLRKLQKWFDKRLVLSAKLKDGSWHSIPLNVIGFEEEAEATWFYLESNTLPAKVVQWRFENTCLFQEHEAQIHVVHAEIGPDFRKSESLNRKRPSFDF